MELTYLRTVMWSKLVILILVQPVESTISHLFTPDCIWHTKDGQAGRQAAVNGKHAALNISNSSRSKFKPTDPHSYCLDNYSSRKKDQKYWKINAASLSFYLSLSLSNPPKHPTATVEYGLDIKFFLFFWNENNVFFLNFVKEISVNEISRDYSTELFEKNQFNF